MPHPHNQKIDILLASNTEEPTLNDSKAPNQVTKLIVRVYKASAATFIADGKDNKVDTKKAIVRRSVNMMLSPRTELAVDGMLVPAEPSHSKH